ncbi:MAG: acyl carrier protein [Clostridia bacterium]|nr:acyl carrier protein [Oscillospiraceae bacterium]MBQ7033799.1 acyl carrier protein [Clostridia bacterium]
MVFEKVAELIADQLGIDAESITEEDAFIDTLGADSLDIVELIMAFEDEFSLSISDEDAENIRTVGDAVAYIKSHA